MTYSYIMSVSVSFLEMNWQKLGMSLVPHLVSILISVGLGILGFRKWITPGITEALEEASKTSTMLGNLGAIKKADWNDNQALEAVISKELILNKMPEIELLRLALSPTSWEQVEEMIQENPAVALQLYEKYKHLLGGTTQTQERYMF